ncbi:glycosyltransferase [Pseudomonas japonica]|uniref:glycosyltransferase n=1 Tax=Pseudomonas japonica TaxID=256466 RepID=UPI0015E32511|nr:glycosyltransferase [Pseudomonas japonica]MBA1241970.1 glycosyltransferase [Pseudomonas japonica]
MGTYDNPVFHDNVYGHTLAVIGRKTRVEEGLHLDIGCSYARLGEAVEAQLERTYVGFDIDDEALEAVRSRGLRAHKLDLSDLAAARGVLDDAIASEKVLSISILDTLEHVANPLEVLIFLREVALKFNCPILVTVPNMAHRDVGFKLAFGAWDKTEKGLLDKTHLQFFNDKIVSDLLSRAGLHEIDRYDVLLEQSDQHFPTYHPALATSTPLNKFLHNLRDGVDASASVNQFVRLCLPGPVVPEPAKSESRPFLSIITRTQGRRPDTLRDVLLCLSAQTEQDFELLIIGHRLDKASQLLVERLIDDTHATFRKKVRFILVDKGNRTEPLNVGFSSARGDYVAILDDDDIVLANWVEHFKSLAVTNPGRVLRATAVAQSWEPVTTLHGTKSVRAVGGMETRYPNHFDYFTHLIQNETPPVSLAFPADCFRALGLRFDDTLTTTEDWDFLIRTAAICGVGSSPEITSIYRQWHSGESSFTVHSSEEWTANHYAIWKKLDSLPLLLDTGGATRVRQLVTFWLERSNQGKEQPLLPLPHPDLEAEQYKNALRDRIHNRLHSKAWRITYPIRLFGMLLGRRFSYPQLWAMDAAALENYTAQLQQSSSIRVAEKLKRIAYKIGFR